MRALVRLGLRLVLLGTLACVALGAWVWSFGERPVVTRDATHRVEPGRSGRAVLGELIDAGVLVSDPRWRVWSRLLPLGCLQAGRVTLRADMRPPELAAALCRAERDDLVVVTFPEGETLWDVADRLDAAGVCDRDSFVAVATDPAFAAALGVPGESLEGFLFPDTWELERGAAPEAVARRMVSRADAVWAELAAEGSGAEGGLDRYGVITLASMIEREAALAEERPRIARVFLNRLREGMPLQSDPSCTYGPTTYRERPTRALCRDASSRWSTYVIRALPPTPIASPGRGAMEAVLRPDGPSSELYFVSMEDGTGRHAFASTLAEHNANVRRYLRGE